MAFLAEALPTGTNINDMPELIAALIKLYADDAKIYSSVSLTSQNNNQVQISLAESVQWAKDWFMFYNFTKCHHLQVGKCNTDTRYTMKSGNGIYVLKKVKYEKDLGVIIDNNLMFRNHITSKVNLANRNLGTSFRSISYLDHENFYTSINPW